MKRNPAQAHRLCPAEYRSEMPVALQSAVALLLCQAASQPQQCFEDTAALVQRQRVRWRGGPHAMPHLLEPAPQRPWRPVARESVAQTAKKCGARGFGVLLGMQLSSVIGLDGVKSSKSKTLGPRSCSRAEVLIFLFLENASILEPRETFHQLHECRLCGHRVQVLCEPLRDVLRTSRRSEASSRRV